MTSFYIGDIDNETIKNYIEDVFGKADEYGYVHVPVDSLGAKLIKGIFGDNSFIGKIKKLSDGNFYYFDPDNLTAYKISPEKTCSIYNSTYRILF